MPLPLTDARWSELRSSYDGTEDIVTWLAEMQISETTAAALVITGEVLAEGGMKILRKKKARSTQSDFQEMLGVTVPIPQDVLDALGIDNG